MKLNFLGYEGAFGTSHTNAYLYFDDETLIIIDLSMLSIMKAKELVTDKVKRVFILVTHMHDDHFSGIPTFMHWNYFVAKRKVWLVTAEELLPDIQTEMGIKGVSREQYLYATILKQIRNAHSYTYWYNGAPVDSCDIYDMEKFLISTLDLKFIATTHAPEIEGRCFGVSFLYQGKRIVYTGDTNTLDPFTNHIISREGPDVEFYTEMSFHYGGVHLLWKNEKMNLLTLINSCNLMNETCDVYLMHMDDPDALEKEVSDLDNIYTVNGRYVIYNIKRKRWL